MNSKPDRPPRRPELPALTSVRAIAALAVFAYHLGFQQSVPVLAPLGLGYTGVTLFFVLSGFVLTWTFDPTQSRRQFYLRRVARVYPAHLAVFAVVVAVAAVAGRPIGPGVYLPSLALIQAWWTDADVSFGVNDVSWSLSCEAFFYALFPLAVVGLHRLRPRVMWCVVGLCYAGYVAVVTLVASRLHDPDLPHVVYTNPAVRLPEFLVGIAVARTVIGGARVPVWAFAAAAGTAVVGAVVAPQWPAPTAWLTPAAAVAIAYLARRDLAGGNRLLHLRPLHYAGRLSFAFYLVHLMILERLDASYGTGVGTAGAAFVVSWAAAAVLHHLVELPAHRWIVAAARRRSGPPGADRPGRIAAGV